MVTFKIIFTHISHLNEASIPVTTKACFPLLVKPTRLCTLAPATNSAESKTKNLSSPLSRQLNLRLTFFAVVTLEEYDGFSVGGGANEILLLLLPPPPPLLQAYPRHYPVT